MECRNARADERGSVFTFDCGGSRWEVHTLETEVKDDSGGDPRVTTGLPGRTLEQSSRNVKTVPEGLYTPKRGVGLPLREREGEREEGGEGKDRGLRGVSEVRPGLDESTGKRLSETDLPSGKRLTGGSRKAPE